MYVFSIAFRYMRRRVTTWLTVGSIFILVFMFVIVMPVLLGFGDFLREHVRKTNSHIEVDRASVQGISEYEQLGKRILDSCPLVKDWTPRMQGVALLQTQRFRFYSPLIGIDVALEREVERRRGKKGIASVDGMPKKPRTLKSDGPVRFALVGKKLADELQINPGDLLTLTAQTGPDGEASQIIFEVMDVYEAGSIWFDRFVIIDYREAQKLYKMGNAVSSLGLWLDDYEQADVAQNQVCLMNLEPLPELRQLFDKLKEHGKPASARELAPKLGAKTEFTHDLLVELWGYGAVQPHSDGLRFEAVDGFDPATLRPSDDEKTVYGALLGADEPLGPVALATTTGLSADRVKSVLRRLQRRGGATELFELREPGRAPVRKPEDHFHPDIRSEIKPANVFISANPGGLRVRTWREQQPDVFQAITMQNSIMTLIFAVLSLVVAILILALMLILVGQKRKDIGVLRGMGATRKGILGIFLLNGAGIGVISAVLGITFGVLALKTIVPKILPELSMTMFGIKELQSTVTAGFLALVFVCVVGLTTLASVFPAWRATKVDPLEAIRYE